MEEDNDLGNQKQHTKVDSFQAFPTQIEVEKLLNDLERNDQILLLHCLGVRETTIQELMSLSSSNNNNPKQAFFSFLKEWDFFQTPLQTINCIRRMYHAQHQNQQEIPLKFFNALTINRLLAKFEPKQSQIEKFCNYFEIENDEQSILKYFEKEKYFASLDNIRSFDSLLLNLDDSIFDEFRTLIAEALSCYCGDKAYVSIICTKPSETTAKLLAVFHKYFGKIIPSEFSLRKEENRVRILTSVMKWQALSTDNCGWEKDLTKLKDFGLDIKINLDGLESGRMPRRIELSENSVTLKIMSKCSQWYFEKDKEKRSLMWKTLGPVVAYFLSSEKPGNSVAKQIHEWIKSQNDEKIEKTICDILDLDVEVVKTYGTNWSILHNDWKVLKFIEAIEQKLNTKNKDYDFPTMKVLLNEVSKIALGELKL